MQTHGVLKSHMVQESVYAREGTFAREGQQHTGGHDRCDKWTFSPLPPWKRLEAEWVHWAAASSALGPPPLFLLG